jgi:predicted glycosyltransferase
MKHIVFIKETGVMSSPQIDTLMNDNIHSACLDEGDAESQPIFSRTARIWIDLENSPHVPFFKPIIQELERKGYSVLVTARDCFQVCDLADQAQLRYKRIGHHYGKRTVAKLAGLGIRAAQLAPTVLRYKPTVAVSHGSRSLFLLSSILRIPTITMFDYEHSRWIKPIGTHWVIAPDVMPESKILEIGIRKDRILRYPGIKEEVYVPFFRPDASIRQQLNLRESEVVVTIRPPATEAHYRNPESDVLMRAVFELIARSENTTAVLLPRTPTQEAEFRTEWATLFERRRVIVPKTVVDGLNLIWFSDLVVSGGGTMNREAAALGLPVYSIFRGTACAVDRHLESTGRLVLIRSAAEVFQKIALVPRHNRVETLRNKRVLDAIVQGITAIADSRAASACGSS